MPEDDLGRLREYAASNRARLSNVEREVEKVRDRLHELEGTVFALTVARDRVAELATQLKEIAAALATLSGRVLARPRPTTLAVVGQYFGLLIALAALALTLSR